MARKRQSLFWGAAAWVRRWGYRLEKGRPHVVGLVAELDRCLPALPLSPDHDDLTLVNGDELVSRVLVIAEK